MLIKAKNQTAFLLQTLHFVYKTYKMASRITFKFKKSVDLLDDLKKI